MNHGRLKPRIGLLSKAESVRDGDGIKRTAAAMFSLSERVNFKPKSLLKEFL